LSTDSSELDDIVLPFRPNPRSKAQQALKKGLGPLADTIEAQEVEEGSLEELAEKYVGTSSTLKTIDDVLAGVKDILAERFAYDESVRSMVREFGYDEGFFEVIPRNKKDRQFTAYRGKMISPEDLSPEETLHLLHAEDKKQIRLKHGVQLFMITEFLREHFIYNPDSIGFDIICQAIDDCWTRLLQPVVERYVKSRLKERAEAWAVNQISKALDTEADEQGKSGPILAVGLTGKHDLTIVTISDEGHMLGATRERIKRPDQIPFSNRIRQFYTRHRPMSVLIIENEFADVAEAVTKKSIDEGANGPAIIRQKSDEQKSDLPASEWMKEKYADLDDAMKKAYAAGLLYLRPLSIIPLVGTRFFRIHSLQKYVTEEALAKLIVRKITEQALHKGIPALEIGNSVLREFPGVTEEIIGEIRREAGREPFTVKADLRRVKGIGEVVFANISGYVVLPAAPSILDRITVHPDHFEWVTAMAEELNISVETLVQDPDQLHGVSSDDPSRKIYIEKKLINQLRAGQPKLAQPTAQQQRRLRLHEIEEGSIQSGRVTNITPFGVFVDINAVCDGLVHISQLADGYVESPEQVVSVGDKVDVRVIKVDAKKRRISLSMKNLGPRGKRISPTKAQLSTLADHFKER
ncbi:MAG: S1 RNA-binding domain-containing protein, partial [Chitinivibrionales bacterium]|nr:S1 RNA-binding domain-containing protein [Chitinivibrionales bacterium]MBD3356816.1 S1 RNA-binding domain-containing protein [Chitinivibrionales bacterium]